ncbi:hypothetical protein B7494_g2371 [Chlorociboria aeruginascens]|nr:hypothetical protein B7494_g2371 [Chlorociboria aeruginascens]
MGTVWEIDHDRYVAHLDLACSTDYDGAHVKDSEIAGSRDNIDPSLLEPGLALPAYHEEIRARSAAEDSSAKNSGIPDSFQDKLKKLKDQNAGFLSKPTTTISDPRIDQQSTSTSIEVNDGSPEDYIAFPPSCVKHFDRSSSPEVANLSYISAPNSTSAGNVGSSSGKLKEDNIHEQIEVLLRDIKEYERVEISMVCNPNLYISINYDNQDLVCQERRRNETSRTTNEREILQIKFQQHYTPQYSANPAPFFKIPEHLVHENSNKLSSLLSSKRSNLLDDADDLLIYDFEKCRSDYPDTYPPSNITVINGDAVVLACAEVGDPFAAIISKFTEEERWGALEQCFYKNKQHPRNLKRRYRVLACALFLGGKISFFERLADVVGFPEEPDRNEDEKKFSALRGLREKDSATTPTLLSSDHKPQLDVNVTISIPISDLSTFTNLT